MKPLRILALVLGGGLLGACSAPLMEYSTGMPALQLRVLGQPGLADGRPRFREIFCTLLARSPGATADSCERHLLRLVDEPGGTRPARPLPAHDPRLHILFVPGAFAECLGEDAMPYPDAVARLSQLGYPIRVLPVGGRSGTGHNATLIAAAVEAEQLPAGASLALVGYSKGAVDILEFLAAYPALAGRVNAAVSIAGTIGGTPLADAYAETYSVVAGIDLARCDAGDRRVVEDLRHGPRSEWLARTRLPAHIRYLSLGAIATDADTARLMYLARRRLNRAEPLNDGQVPFHHQLIPGGTLLGYAAGDHWAITLPLQERWPYWGGNSAGSHYPRAALFEAIVLSIVETLADGEPDGGVSR